MTPPAGRRGAPGDAPHVTRRKALLVTLVAFVSAAGVVALAVLHPLWLLAIPAAAFLAAGVAGVALFVRARAVARRRERSDPDHAGGER